MKSFVELPVADQAAIVLVTLLEDVALGKRSMASVQYAVGDLYQLLASSFDIPAKEARQVAAAVARHGIRVLPGYQEDPNDIRGTGDIRDSEPVELGGIETFGGDPLGSGGSGNPIGGSTTPTL